MKTRWVRLRLVASRHPAALCDWFCERDVHPSAARLCAATMVKTACSVSTVVAVNPCTQRRALQVCVKDLASSIGKVLATNTAESKVHGRATCHPCMLAAARVLCLSACHPRLASPRVAATARARSTRLSSAAVARSRCLVGAGRQLRPETEPPPTITHAIPTAPHNSKSMRCARLGRNCVKTLLPRSQASKKTQPRTSPN